MKIEGYANLSSDSLENLDKMVLEKMAAGWQPLDGVVIGPSWMDRHDECTKTLYIQTMIKLPTTPTVLGPAIALPRR